MNIQDMDFVIIIFWRYVDRSDIRLKIILGEEYEDIAPFIAGPIDCSVDSHAFKTVLLQKKAYLLIIIF